MNHLSVAVFYWTVLFSVLYLCLGSQTALAAADGRSSAAGSWAIAETCCLGCSYSNPAQCCCAKIKGTVTKKITVRKTVTRKQTLSVVRSTTVATVTRTITQSAPGRRLGRRVDEQAFEPSFVVKIREQLQQEPDSLEKLMLDEPETLSDPVSTQVDESEDITLVPALLKRHLCPKCPSGVAIKVQNGKHSSGDLSYCCPTRQTVTQRKTKLITSTRKVTKVRTLKITATKAVTRGFPVSQVVQGRVFNDTNDNGVYDVGVDRPMGFINIVLNLVSPARGRSRNLVRRANGVVILAETQTDAEGLYKFTAGIAAQEQVAIATKDEPSVPLVVIAAASDGKLPNDGKVDVALDDGRKTAATTVGQPPETAIAGQTTTAPGQTTAPGSRATTANIAAPSVTTGTAEPATAAVSTSAAQATTVFVGAPSNSAAGISHTKETSSLTLSTSSRSPTSSSHSETHTSSSHSATHSSSSQSHSPTTTAAVAITTSSFSPTTSFTQTSSTSFSATRTQSSTSFTTSKSATSSSATATKTQTMTSSTSMAATKTQSTTSLTTTQTTQTTSTSLTTFTMTTLTNAPSSQPAGFNGPNCNNYTVRLNGISAINAVGSMVVLPSGTVLMLDSASNSPYRTRIWSFTAIDNSTWTKSVVFDKNYTTTAEAFLYATSTNRLYILEGSLGISGKVHVIDANTFSEISNCTMNSDNKRGYAVDSAGRIYYSSTSGANVPYTQTVKRFNSTCTTAQTVVNSGIGTGALGGTIAIDENGGRFNLIITITDPNSQSVWTANLNSAIPAAATVLSGCGTSSYPVYIAMLPSGDFFLTANTANKICFRNGTASKSAGSGIWGQTYTSSNGSFIYGTKTYSEAYSPVQWAVNLGAGTLSNRKGLAPIIPTWINSLAFDPTTKTVYGSDFTGLNGNVLYWFGLDGTWGQIGTTTHNGATGVAIDANTSSLLGTWGSSVSVYDKVTGAYVSSTGLSTSNPQYWNIAASQAGAPGLTILAGLGVSSVEKWTSTTGTVVLDNLAPMFTSGSTSSSGGYWERSYYAVTVAWNGDVYASTVGYWCDTGGGSCTDSSTPAYVYKWANGTNTRTTVKVMDADTIASASASAYGTQMTQDYDYSSHWYSVPIVAMGNDLYIGWWDANGSVARLPNGNASQAIVLDTRLRGTNVLAATEGTLYVGQGGSGSTIIASCSDPGFYN